MVVNTTRKLLAESPVMCWWSGKQSRKFPTNNKDIKKLVGVGADSPLSITTVKQLIKFDELSFWKMLSENGIEILYQGSLYIHMVGNRQSIQLTVTNSLTNDIERYTIANKSFLEARSQSTNTNIIDILTSLHKALNN